MFVHMHMGRAEVEKLTHNVIKRLAIDVQTYLSSD